VWVYIEGGVAMAKLEEYTDRWAALRDELWAAEKRIKEIRKELPLLEAWMEGLERGGMRRTVISRREIPLTDAG
jgi:hypothetical protein